jgi:two-component system sensor histidine kinase BarA
MAQHLWRQRALQITIVISMALLYYVFTQVNNTLQLLLFGGISLLCTLLLMTALQKPWFFYPRPNSRNSKKNNLDLLIIDDYMNEQSDIYEMLIQRSFNIAVASTTQNIAHILKTISCKAILIDLQRQIVTDFSLVKKIRSHEKPGERIPILAVNASGSNDEKLSALSAGIDDYIPTPINQELFDKQIQRWLNISSADSTQTQTHTINTFAATKETPNSPEPLTLTKNIPAEKTLTRVIDLKKSLTYSHNNPELARDMLNMLITMIKEEKSNMRQLYEEKKWDQLAQLVHKLNGGSCYCGVPELQQHAQEVDQALEEKSYLLASRHFPALLDAMENLLLWEAEHDLDIIFMVEK